MEVLSFVAAAALNKTFPSFSLYVVGGTKCPLLTILMISENYSTFPDLFLGVDSSPCDGCVGFFCVGGVGDF